MELVSIITPVFNSEQFISATIQSVLNQTYPHWEMILVDDCSSDNSLEIIKEFARKDNRILCLSQKVNQGQVAARNMAIAHSNGRFIAFLDSDDLWSPTKLEVQLNYFFDKNTALVFSFYEQIDEEGNLLGKKMVSPLELNYKNLLSNNYIGCLTAIYDSKKMGKLFMPNVKKRDDWALWLKILRNGGIAYCVPEYLAFYRVRKKSLSSNKFSVIKYNWKVLRDLENQPLIKAIYHFTYYLLHHLDNRIFK